MDCFNSKSRITRRTLPPMCSMRCEFLVIESIERGIVPGFAGLDEAVIEPLTRAGTLALLPSVSMAGTCQSHIDGAVGITGARPDQALAREIAKWFLVSSQITPVALTSEIFDGKCTKRTNISQRLHV